MTNIRDAKDVQKFVKDKNVSFIQFWFTDVLGKLKSFSVTPSELEEGMAEGMGFDGSSIEGFARIEESDMIAMPDPKTFQLIPWRPSDRPVARMFCDIMNPDGTPYMGDPRYALKRILAKIAKQGYTYLRGARARVLLLRQRQRSRDPGSGRLLRRPSHRPRHGPAPPDDLRTPEHGHPRRVQPPRGGPEPARDRPAVPRRPDHVRHGHDLPRGRQGDRPAERRLRHLHAQAHLRPERKRHARPPVALQGQQERLLRPQGQVPPLRAWPRATSPGSCGTPARSRPSPTSG